MASLFIARPPGLRDRVRASAENRPGVYWMSDRQGAVIYVGRSVRVRTRLLSYFRGPAESKPRRIIRDAAAIDWRYAPGEFGARLEELRAIRRLRPRYNRQLKGVGGYHFLRLGPAGVPRLRVVRRVRPDGSRYYGPYRGKPWLEETARILSDWAGLRTCAEATPMRLADQGMLFGDPPTPLCPRFELGRCAGPCAERCGEEGYAARVRRVDAFLVGEDSGPIDDIRAGMERAAANFQFEYAARLRDQIDRLLDYRSLRDTEMWRLRDLTGAYAVPLSASDRCWWYFFVRGRVLAEVEGGPRVPADFSSLAREHREAHQVERPTADNPLAAQEAGLVAAWFEARPDERDRLISPEEILRRR